MSSRIRIGIIGLSANSTGTNWGGVAHFPYLSSEQGKKYYEIVAVCNSSVDSAKKSITHYKLPEGTKAYGSPDDLANDPDVDLVVNITHVTNHHRLCMPSVRAGKKVFTELPLASNREQMKEMYETAKAKGIVTVMGMQGQTSPCTKVLKDIIASGRIGKVLSSMWVGHWDFMAEKPTPIGSKTMADRANGADNLSVTFLHSYNQIAEVLGELKSFDSIMGVQRPTVDICDPEQDNKIVETIPKTIADHIFLQGRFESGAVFSWNFRGGEPFPGQSNLSWEIYGEKGVILVEAPIAFADIITKGVTIKLREFSKKEAEEFPLPEDELSSLPDPAQNVGRIYDAYAKGQKGVYPDWELGMKRHAIINQIWDQYDGKQPSGEPVNIAI